MIYALLSALLFGTGIFVVKLTSTRISPLIASAIFSVVNLIIQLLVIWAFKIKGKILPVTSGGIVFSVLGGLFIGTYTILVFFAFSKMDVTKVTPIVYVGAIVISSLLGVIILGERLNLINILGVLLALGGLVLLFVK